MAIEHLLGGPNTPASFSSAISMSGTESANTIKTLPIAIFHPGTTRVKKINTEGRCTVTKATAAGYTLYFKFFPEIPGIEQAVSKLSHELIGFGTSLSEVFKVESPISVPILKPGLVTGESLVEETVSNVPVLVSLEVEGRTLKEVFENPIDPKSHINVLENLDEDSLHTMMLMAMLINPEDGKGDNYIAEPYRNKEGKLKYRIIGIDNDHAFVPALTESKGRQAKMNTKTILYAFDQITTPISEEVQRVFTGLDIDTSLRSWLTGLRGLNDRYAQVFDNQQHNDLLFDRYRSVVGVPFAEGLIGYLYTKLIRLRQALQRGQTTPLTPLDLFAEIEPLLKGRYGQTIKTLPNMTAQERFKVIEGLSASKTLSRPLDVLSSYRIPKDAKSRRAVLRGEQYSPGQATDELERIIDVEFDAIQSGQLKSFNQLIRGDQIETALREIDFGGLSLEENRRFLKAIEEKLAFILRLTLRNHLTIKTADLKKWSGDVFKRLTHVVLTGCTGVNEGGLRFLAENADNLEYLEISRNNKLQTVASRALVGGGLLSSLPLSFKSLKHLEVSECPELSQVDVEASALETLKVQGSHSLARLDGTFLQLRYLDIRGTSALDNTKVADFIVSNTQFLKEGHLESDEQSPSAQLVRDMQRFIRGKLIYRPNGNSDVGKIELRIADLLNPWEGTFDLSWCGDARKYLSISTGYRKGKKAENQNKLEIWFAPKFLIERDQRTKARHFRDIMGDWSNDAPIGIFWTDGDWNDLTWMDYLTNQDMNSLADNNLHKKWLSASLCDDASRWHFARAIDHFMLDLN